MKKNFIFCWLLIITIPCKTQTKQDSILNEIVQTEFALFQKEKPEHALLFKKSELYAQLNDYKNATASLERIKTSVLPDSFQFLMYHHLAYYTFLNKEYHHSLKYIKKALSINSDKKLNELEMINLIELNHIDELQQKYPALLDSSLVISMNELQQKETSLKWYYYLFPGMGIIKEKETKVGVYSIILESGFLTSIILHAIYLYPASIIVLGVYPFLKFYLGGLERIKELQEKHIKEEKKAIKTKLFKRVLSYK